jgi:hypothetical protein
MAPRTVATIIFGTVFVIAFAVMSPVILISRLDGRHTERTTHAEFSHR